MRLYFAEGHAEVREAGAALQNLAVLFLQSHLGN